MPFSSKNKVYVLLESGSIYLQLRARLGYRKFFGGLLS